MPSDHSAEIAIDALAESILAYLHLCEESEPHALRVPLATMDGAVPLALGNAKSLPGPDNELLIPANTGTPALWPVDVRTVIRSKPEHFDNPADRWPVGTLQFLRVHSIATKEARPFGASRFSRFMIMDECVSAMPDGTAKSCRAPMALIGGQWMNAAPKRITSMRDSYAVSIALGTALALRYEWSVWIGYASGPRLRFLTDPLGAREVFRLRDLPPGRERRAALRHWVSAHARKRHPEMDDEARIWVRKHLRGATDFTWNGLRCRIQPDEFSLEQMAKGSRPG